MEVETDVEVGVRRGDIMVLGDVMVVDQLVAKMAVVGDSCCDGDDGDPL